MPKIFKTMFWAAALCLVVTVLVAMFLPAGLDLILWFGLTFVLGIYAGAAILVLSLNEFQMRAEEDGAPCIHTVRGLRWWLAAMIGPSSDCGYSAALPASPSRPTSSSRSSSAGKSLKVGEYEVQPQGAATRIDLKPI